MKERIASLGQAVRFLTALLLLAVCAAADLSVVSTLQDGQRVLYYFAGRAAAKETPLSGYAMAGMKLREVTNGRRLVQAVYKGNKLLECEIVRRGGKKLWKEAKEVRSKHFNSTTGIDTFGAGLAWLDLAALSRDCRRKKKQLSKNKGSMYRSQPRRHSRYRTQLKTVQLDHMAKGHKHLAKQDIITPGTKWCGPSNRAMKYTDFGGFWEPDKCCRTHDMCAMSILPMEHKYSYANIGPFTLSHCSCDRRFRACLKMTRTTASDFVGKMFFNVIQRQCFVLQPEKICVRRNWNGKCQSYEIRKKAVLIDNQPYYKRAVFTFAVASLAWLLLFNIKLSDAQVTFSRDWNAGKRSLSLAECSSPLRSAAGVCQMLMNELRAITSCEIKALLAAKGEENEADVFFPQRTG